jgi:hypothetical protein
MKVGKFSFHHSARAGPLPIIEDAGQISLGKALRSIVAPQRCQFSPDMHSQPRCFTAGFRKGMP